MLNFYISGDEQQKISDWLISIDKQIKAAEIDRRKNLKLKTNNIEPYYGAIGGGLTYMFTPTGLGTIKTVVEAHTGEKLDLTDYDGF